MTYAEIKELLNAGFTRDDIMSFLNPAAAAPAPAQLLTNTPEVNPAEDPAADPAPSPDESPAAAPVPAADPAPAADPQALNQLNENISKLIRTIQTSNLQSAYTDKPAGEDITNKVDKIMQSIIRPETTN